MDSKGAEAAFTAVAAPANHARRPAPVGSSPAPVARSISSLTLIGLGAFLVAPPATASDAVPFSFDVTSAKDDGRPGTLRWAIEQANKSSGRSIIHLKGEGSGPLVIRLRRQLPAITAPMEIRGDWTKDSITKPRVVLDGAGFIDLAPRMAFGEPRNCPGVKPGTYGPNVRGLANAGITIADTANVRISGFEIRNFCIGLVALRSRAAVISDMRFENNLGAAALLLTGDDGTPAGGATSGTGGHIVQNNVFLNNSDGIDLVRGDRGTILRGNVLSNDRLGLVAPGSGIEICCEAREATLEDNYLTGYAEALQLLGDGHRVSGNVLEGNSVALSLTGKGNLVAGNRVRGNRAGIVVRPGGVSRLSRNLVYGNGRAIALCGLGGKKGLRPDDRRADCADGLPDCDQAQNAPKILTAILDGARLSVRGQLKSRPEQDFVVELFAGPVSSTGEADAQRFLAAVPVRTDGKGQADFGVDRLPVASMSTDMAVTAIAIRASGLSSQLARPRPVSFAASAVNAAHGARTTDHPIQITPGRD